MALMVMVTCAVGLVATVAVGWMSSRARVAQVADLAALAGAQAEAAGAEPCPVAAEVARRNGAQVTECRLQGGADSFVLTVRVASDLRPRLPAPAPKRVQVTAAAGR